MSATEGQSSVAFIQGTRVSIENLDPSLSFFLFYRKILNILRTIIYQRCSLVHSPSSHRDRQFVNVKENSPKNSQRPVDVSSSPPVATLYEPLLMKDDDTVCECVVTCHSLSDAPRHIRKNAFGSYH